MTHLMTNPNPEVAELRRLLDQRNMLDLIIDFDGITARLHEYNGDAWLTNFNVKENTLYVAAILANRSHEREHGYRLEIRKDAYMSNGALDETAMSLHRVKLDTYDGACLSEFWNGFRTIRDVRDMARNLKAAPTEFGDRGEPQ